MFGRKTGGRTAGTPNKSTRQVRRFLDGVFSKALSDPQFEERLVRSIVEMTIDTKLLGLLLAYYIGRPAQAVDHTHSGTVTLAQIIAGRVPRDTEGDSDADVAAGDDVWDSRRRAS